MGNTTQPTDTPDTLTLLDTLNASVLDLAHNLERG